VSERYIPCKRPANEAQKVCGFAALAMASLDPGGHSLGCFNPRRVAGSAHTWSVHACGRALDWRPSSRARGREVARWIAWFGHADIQLIIFDGEQWGGRFGRGWRPYTGADKHVDHIHIEFATDVPTVDIATGARVA